jgi:hypothetical protein
MFRCAIFSIVDYSNYGNRLVCAATCKIFASLGVDAEIMLVKKSKTLSFFAKLKRKKALSYRFDKMIVKICHFFTMYLAKKYKYSKLIQLRRDRFVAFSAEHIVEKNYGVSDTSFPPSFPAEFDFFAVGGDQVWNPFFDNTNTPDSIYFLPFTRNGKRAFMFSTSFGVSKNAFFAKMAEIPGLLEAYRDALSRMSYIACREDAGAEITNSLVGRGQVLIDPTMALTRQEWLEIAREPEFLKPRVDAKRGYALTYFLGDFSPSLKKKIKKACTNDNLVLIALNDFADASVYTADPAEFVYLVANAQAIYTDSFHGAAFSILFEIPFYVFERIGHEVDMLSRMDTLLRKFALEDRLVKNVSGFYPEGGTLVMDFSKTRKILSEEREKAIRFLKMAFSAMESASVEPR